MTDDIPTDADSSPGAASERASLLPRALLAFLMLPGVVAYLVPILVGGDVRSDGPLAVYVAVLAVAFHLRVMFVEERWLAASFGETWQMYAQHVRRWL